MMRVMLYEAAQSMLRSKKWSWLKAWAMQIARRRGMKKAPYAFSAMTFPLGRWPSFAGTSLPRKRTGCLKAERGTKITPWSKTEIAIKSAPAKFNCDTSLSF